MRKFFSVGKYVFSSFLICLLHLVSHAQPKLSERSSDNLEKKASFIRGEVLTYRVHYGWVDAGEAILEVTNEKIRIDGKQTFHMIGTGRSVGAFNWFFKVRDRYESYIDDEKNVPLVFKRRVNEGGYIINQDQLYNHDNNTVDSDGNTMDVPVGIQDMLSAFYYARNLDFENAQIGDEFTVNTFLDDEIFPLKIKYAGKEMIKNSLGEFACRKFHPVVQKGRVFNEKKDLSVWISDDRNCIPIRVEAKLFVGSAKMDLKDYKGLANPIAMANDN
jgi:hypothetical protein